MDVDSLIEREQNSSVADIFKNKGEEYFRSLEQKCINKLTEMTGQVIATGGGLPIHSSLSKNSLIIYIETSFDVILNRLPAKERDKRPLFYNETRARALFDERINIYKEQADFCVDADQKIQTISHSLADFILDKRVL